MPLAFLHADTRHDRGVRERSLEIRVRITTNFLRREPLYFTHVARVKHARKSGGDGVDTEDVAETNRVAFGQTLGRHHAALGEN